MDSCSFPRAVGSFRLCGPEWKYAQMYLAACEMKELKLRTSLDRSSMKVILDCLD